MAHGICGISQGNVGLPAMGSRNRFTEFEWLLLPTGSIGRSTIPIWSHANSRATNARQARTYFFAIVDITCSFAIGTASITEIMSGAIGSVMPFPATWFIGPATMLLLVSMFLRKVGILK